MTAQQVHTDTPRRQQMRSTRSRTSRAQDAAFCMSTSVPSLPCGELGAQWHSCERDIVALLGRRLDVEAVEEAAPLTSSCSKCPILEQCAEWGATDRYTGVAGGQVLQRGKKVRRS
ncbi:hypothetical protein [Dietzia cercidiphylli]|jgi:hypothetical protein|uniref:hypothetical protein n=1 Tax=Dietzia cercidiphylli TaxID=498199 RepID=UPI00223B1E04|nr:hypothetical protein [Dietzia cercidiphylli]MCT1515307.1 hypothetical protein [Dietzia cercidiphylli]